MLAGEIKDFVSIKIKYRSDSLSDQFSRVLIMKMLLVCCSVMGLSWFKDSINCIVPDSANLDKDFVSSACWIQGVFIYEELKNRVEQDIAFYGIPKDINRNGVLEETGESCNTEDGFFKISNSVCKPMSKTFYLQYQWFPFFIAGLSVCFYLPYILHLIANEDLISLKKSIKAEETTADSILSSFFNTKTTAKTRWLRLRIIYNYFIKIAYVVVNVASFVLTDQILLGKFKGYGSRWLEWSKLPNTLAHDYMGLRDHPKPGNEVLPPFGYCELYQSSKDIKHSTANRHRFVCELSQHILYQYCLIVVWFLLVSGIVVSCAGLLSLLLDHIVTLACVYFRGSSARKMYRSLALRECEYLEFIRKRNIPLYSEIVLKLRMEKYRNGGVMHQGRQTPLDTPPPAFDELSAKSTSHV